MEVSILISLTAVAVSVLSPVIVTVLNNWHQKKLRLLEFRVQHRAEIIEGFIRTVSEACKFTTAEKISKVGTYSSEIYLYLDESFWSDIDLINSILIYNYSKERIPEAQAAIISIAKSLSSDNVRPEKYKAS